MAIFLLAVIGLAALAIALQTPACAQALLAVCSTLRGIGKAFDDFWDKNPRATAAWVAGVAAVLIAAYCLWQDGIGSVAGRCDTRAMLYGDNRAIEDCKAVVQRLHELGLR